MSRLIRIQWQRSACLCVTKFTATSTDITSYHEGGGSFSPAFAPIGATSAAANGVQAVGVNDTFGFRITFVGSNTYLEPFGLTYSIFHFSSLSKKFVSFVYR